MKTAKEMKVIFVLSKKSLIHTSPSFLSFILAFTLSMDPFSSEWFVFSFHTVNKYGKKQCVILNVLQFL